VPGFWGWLEVDQKPGLMTLRVLKRFETGLRVAELRLPARAKPVTIVVDGQLQSCLPAPGAQSGTEERWRCTLDLDHAGFIEIQA
jgi:hypothetical protein